MIYLYVICRKIHYRGIEMAITVVSFENEVTLLAHPPIIAN